MIKAVYFGAGTDFHYIQYMPEEITNFYFIDSQPFSENGTKATWRYPMVENNCILDLILYVFPFLRSCFFNKVNWSSRPNFIKDLKNNAKAYNIELVSEETNKLVFQYKHQIITYFINTAEPNHLDLISNEIYNFKHIMIMGYSPDKNIIKYTNKKPIFWSNTNTFLCKDIFHDQFAEEDGEINKIIYSLNYNDDFSDEFEEFNIIDDNGTKINFDNWSDLLLYKGGEFI